MKTFNSETKAVAELKTQCARGLDSAMMKTITLKDDPKRFNEFYAHPTPGMTATICRFAAQCYATIYNRSATYVAVRRKRGAGCYWKLVSSGAGYYPHIGSKDVTHYNTDHVTLPVS